MIINTGTTIVTFLMVFLIQNTQNRDGAAIQAKLDELVRATAAHNRYIGIERLTEEELANLRLRCARRAKMDQVPKVEWRGRTRRRRTLTRKLPVLPNRGAGPLH